MTTRTSTEIAAEIAEKEAELNKIDASLKALRAEEESALSASEDPATAAAELIRARSVLSERIEAKDRYTENNEPGVGREEEIYDMDVADLNEAIAEAAAELSLALDSALGKLP